MKPIKKFLEAAERWYEKLDPDVYHDDFDGRIQVMAGKDQDKIISWFDKEKVDSFSKETTHLLIYYKGYPRQTITIQIEDIGDEYYAVCIESDWNSYYKCDELQGVKYLLQDWGYIK